MAIIFELVSGAIPNMPPANALIVSDIPTTKTGVIVPLYTDPTSTTWSTVASVKSSYPSVPMLVIVNPSDGPGTSQDPNYVKGIQKLQSAGVIVLGYIPTNYTKRSINQVTSDIDSYAKFYPSMNGIFFDEMSTSSSLTSYYQFVSDYAYSVGFTYTVGNPGTTTHSAYLSTVNNLTIYESKGLPALNSLDHSGYGKSHFSVIAYGVSTLDKAYVRSLTAYVQYMYITNDNLPNPYDTLPPYFKDLVNTLNSANNQLLTIQSMDQNGKILNGMWMEVYGSDGKTVASGYTPLSVSLPAGGAIYSISADLYYNKIKFDHWSDGSKSNILSISMTSIKTLTAHYINGNVVTNPTQVKLKVQAVDMAGNTISGMWIEIYSADNNNKLVQTGYTTVSYTTTAGLDYNVAPADYQNIRFDHWADGSTDRTRTVTVPNSDTTVVAYYRL
jgi:spherulation-specific family 4 protein